MNKYGLDEIKLNFIRKRDTNCVYCGKKMYRPNLTTFRGDWATIEHLNYLPPWNDISTIVICCGSCNSSRGAKPLLEWFNTSYCIEKSISVDTVTQPVKDYIKSHKYC